MVRRRRSSFFRRHDIGPVEIAIGSFIIICIIFIVMGIVGDIEQSKMRFREYNNGICLSCGGQYEFRQAIGHRNDTTYLYICKRCEHLIELESMFYK